VTVIDEKKKLHERHFFLMSDVILETRLRRSVARASLAGSCPTKRTYKLLVSVLLNGTKVRDVPDGETSLPNVIHLTNASHVYLLSCPSSDAKTEWLANLNGTIERLARDERAMRIAGSKIPASPPPRRTQRKRAGTFDSQDASAGAIGEAAAVGSNGSACSTGKPERRHKEKRHHRRLSEAVTRDDSSPPQPSTTASKT
jgi:hypothetical protein